MVSAAISGIVHIKIASQAENPGRAFVPYVRLRTARRRSMVYSWYMTSNILLSSSGNAGARTFPGLTPVALAFGQVLQRAGQRIGHVYFPTDSLVSILSGAEGDIPVEVGVIGRDGMVGVPLALGEGVSAAHAVVQAAGGAMRSSAADFTKALARRPGMQREVRRFSNELANQVMRTASCNRNHSAAQRLARWLLMMRDRVPGERYMLTQKYLGYMLGVRRAAVSEAAGRLQRRKLIRYTRGSIEILDAKRLKAAACKCYLPWKEDPAAGAPGS
jgi:CRP-like cAMP-binding protein